MKSKIDALLPYLSTQTGGKISLCDSSFLFNNVHDKNH